VQQGKREEAVVCFRRAIDLDPKYTPAHHNLGNALAEQGKLEEAVASFRRALALDPRYAKAHYALGFALGQQGKLEEAVACYHRAIQLNPNYPEAHCSLGHTLIQQGRFREALAALERGHELGPRSPGWRHPSGAWVRAGRRLVELDDRLPAVLSGAEQPANDPERLEFVRVCVLKQRFAAAARLYAEAFASQPRLAADLGAAHRYNAACSAARAGYGQGVDAAGLTGTDRLRWRRQALTWLRNDLADRARLLRTDPTAALQVASTLRHWQADSDLVGLREPAQLARLTVEERAACQSLWADVAALLRQAEGAK
jgi:Tfp pilus assembly protein PilF